MEEKNSLTYRILSKGIVKTNTNLVVSMQSEINKLPFYNNG